MSRIIITIFLFVISSTLFANDFESFDNIQNVTRDFILKTVKLDTDESINIKVNQENSPDHLPRCNKPLEAAYPTNSNTDRITSVEVTCNGNATWRVLIPVNVEIMAKVVVAKRTIPAKENITDDDLDYATYDKLQLYNGYYKDKNELIGNLSAFTIIGGAILTKKSIDLPIIVHRNQIVMLTSTKNAVSVSMQGIAKSDGSVNSMIKVYNPASKRTVDAVVSGPNQAQIVS